jgi:DNA-binding transcriptional ArsR family regulator
MVYRIHFTIQDLARTRVAEAPMPLFELDLAVRALQDRSQPARLDSWRRHARAQLSTQAIMAVSLIPPVGWSFMALAQTGTPEELLEQARAMPRKDINAYMAFIAERQSVPLWAHDLADNSALFGKFVDGLTDLYSVLLGPHEAQIADLLVADRTVRMRQMLVGGVERLLAEANPRWLQWKPPVLEIQMANRVDYDLQLEGRGILLVPSIFSTRSLVDSLAQPQPIVTYPAGHDQSLRRLTTLVSKDVAPKSISTISALLGHTRAAVLSAVAEHPGCSTKELAIHARIAPSSASEHATILRKAGLIKTTRHRNIVIHSPTALAVTLLNNT